MALDADWAENLHSISNSNYIFRTYCFAINTISVKCSNRKDGLSCRHGVKPPLAQGEDRGIQAGNDWVSLRSEHRVRTGGYRLVMTGSV